MGRRQKKVTDQSVNGGGEGGADPMAVTRIVFFLKKIKKKFRMLFIYFHQILKLFLGLVRNLKVFFNAFPKSQLR